MEAESMAGSLSYFDYKGDTGAVYAVKMDTSNGIAVGNTAATPGTDSPPKSLKPRYFVYGTADGLRKRKIIVGDPLTVATPPVNLTLATDVGPLQFNFLYSRGERVSRSRANTGLQV
jgi:hypothetical protein